MVSARKQTAPVEAAVKREIAEVAKRSPGVEKSATAALALCLARALDDDDPLAARVTAAKVLLDVVDRLKATVPAAQATDRLDELATRRAAGKAKAS